MIGKQPCSRCTGLLILAGFVVFTILVADEPGSAQRPKLEVHRVFDGDSPNIHLVAQLRGNSVAPWIEESGASTGRIDEGSRLHWIWRWQVIDPEPVPRASVEGDRRLPCHGSPNGATHGCYRPGAGLVLSRSGDYRVTTENLDAHLVPKRRDPITRESIRRTGKGVAYTKPAVAYLFERIH